MAPSVRIRFFNYFRNIFRIVYLDRFLSTLTNGKGYDSLFVKCLPQNYQYKKGTYRNACRNGINYRLDLSEYMEWVIYFGLVVEERSGLYELVRKNMVVMDIGTNIGETLLNFARLCGSGGMVYGFEPVDENYKKCNFNISLNRFENIRVFNLALSDKQEQLYFGLAENRNSGGIFMNRERQQEGFSIKAIPLDDFVTAHQIKKIHLVKIDVEGFEYHILKGAENTIKKMKPVLFVEVDDANLKRQGSSAFLLEELIRSYGYEIKQATGEPLMNNISAHYDIICQPLNR